MADEVIVWNRISKEISMIDTPRNVRSNSPSKADKSASVLPRSTEVASLARLHGQRDPWCIQLGIGPRITKGSQHIQTLGQKIQALDANQAQKLTLNQAPVWSVLVT